MKSLMSHPLGPWFNKALSELSNQHRVLGACGQTMACSDGGTGLGAGHQNRTGGLGRWPYVPFLSQPHSPTPQVPLSSPFTLGVKKTRVTPSLLTSCQMPPILFLRRNIKDSWHCPLAAGPPQPHSSPPADSDSPSLALLFSLPLHLLNN